MIVDSCYFGFGGSGVCMYIFSFFEFCWYESFCQGSYLFENVVFLLVPFVGLNLWVDIVYI